MKNKITYAQGYRNLRENVGEKLKQARLERNLHLDELADLVKIKVGTLDDIERGYFGKTQFSTIYRIAVCLDKNIKIELSD